MLGPLIAALFFSVFVGANIHHQDVAKQEALKAKYEMQIKKLKQQRRVVSAENHTRPIKMDGIEVANLQEKEKDYA